MAECCRSASSALPPKSGGDDDEIEPLDDDGEMEPEPENELFKGIGLAGAELVPLTVPPPPPPAAPPVALRGDEGDLSSLSRLIIWCIELRRKLSDTRRRRRLSLTGEVEPEDDVSSESMLLCIVEAQQSVAARGSRGASVNRQRWGGEGVARHTREQQLQQPPPER